MTTNYMVAAVKINLATPPAVLFAARRDTIFGGGGCDERTGNDFMQRVASNVTLDGEADGGPIVCLAALATTGSSAIRRLDSIRPAIRRKSETPCRNYSRTARH